MTVIWGSARVSCGALLTQVYALVPRARAVMLYGSHARGTARPDSDVDVLVLVDQDPGHFESGSLTVTAYLPGHLRSLAAQGSLFVRHLCHDGKILDDPVSLLTDILASYRPPNDPDEVTREMEIVASGLRSATPQELSDFGAAIQGLVFYVLRTTIYNSCVIAGHPQFDIGLALDQSRLGHLKPLFQGRRDGYSSALVSRLLDALDEALPVSNSDHRQGIAATAVELSLSHPMASDLLVGVLTGQPIDYTALALPAL